MLVFVSCRITTAAKRRLKTNLISNNYDDMSNAKGTVIPIPNSITQG